MKRWQKNFGRTATRSGNAFNLPPDNAPRAKSSGGSHYGNERGPECEAKADQTIEVVGIVPVTRRALFEKDPSVAIYMPFAQGFQSNVSFFVRFHSLTPGTEAATADLLRRTVRDVDPAIPILSLRTFAQHLDANLQLWIVRAGATLFSIFGGLALCLAVVGLYGVKAYSVARRTREIGIRMALGAQRGTVLRMIMREGSIMLLCGVVLGLLLAMATGKILSGIFIRSVRSIRSPLPPRRCCSRPLPWSRPGSPRVAPRINPMRALRTE